MSIPENACNENLMFIQTVHDGLLCSFLVHVDPVKDNLIYKDLFECNEIGMAVNISLPCPTGPGGNELIEAWTRFCKSNCTEANYIEASSNNLPAIAKARWWAIYSKKVYSTL